MGGELVGWDNGFALTQYGQRFREYRRIVHKFMGTRVQVQRYHSLEERETRKFLRQVLRSPERVAEHIRKSVISTRVGCDKLIRCYRLAGSTILMLTYGYEVQEGDDPLVNLVDRATEQFSDATVPGAFLVDVFPLLRYVPEWFPGAGFQKKAKEWAATTKSVVEIPYAFAEKGVVIVSP